MLILAVDTALGDLLTRAGEVAGGGTVVGATIGFIVGAVTVDLDRLRDPTADSEARRTHAYQLDLAGKGGALGGVFGICVFIFERLG